MIITRGKSQCDGQVSTGINDATKQYSQSPIRSRLSAKLSTESHAQGFLLSVLLGPPGATYRKISEETLDGRPVHVYEGRFGSDVGNTVTRLWFDPASGHPVRLVHEKVLEDGTMRPTEVIDEIAVNVTLADELFRTPAPAGYQVLSLGEQAPPAETISTTPTASGSAFGASLETWHALRISEQAALVVWRRSTPQARRGRPGDWLDDVQFKLDESDVRKLTHTWVHQSGAADRWNWSLLTVDSGKLELRDSILLELSNHGSVVAEQMLVLRLDEEMLREVVAAAGKAMLPEDAARPSLADLREQAKQLAASGRE
jgi:hypothetical protein